MHGLYKAIERLQRSSRGAERATKDKVIVTGYLEILGASVMTFALTNIDDACLLTVLFAQRIPPRRIVAGQYLGFTLIIIVSLLGAFAALAVPPSTMDKGN